MPTLSFMHNDNANTLHKIIDVMGGAGVGVHLSGEKGVGKEDLVKLLYDRSPHRGSPFIKVNCPLLSASEGAGEAPCRRHLISRRHLGGFNPFRLLQQGVLYLHAVDEMDLGLQNRLLALVKRKFQPALHLLGGFKNVMPIFSTSMRPLQECMADGRFNPALGELLSGISIHIPPLRRSPERILPLVDYFIERFIRRDGQRGFSRPTPSQSAALKSHPWPGNVKELQDTVEMALRGNGWDAAIRSLKGGKRKSANYPVVDLSLDGAALMPDFEIENDRMLDRSVESVPVEEMGLMDLVIYEEAIACKKTL
jgi:DNA-binding NtrC family response regulator